MERSDYATAIVETIRQPLVVLDQQHRVVTANPAFYREFSTSERDTQMHTLWELGDHEWDVPALRALVERLLEDGESVEDFEVSHEFEHLGSRVFLVNARRATKQDGQPPLVLVAFEDVTHQRRSERELQRYAERLERSNRDLEEFAHAASHDLQEPLRKVRAFTDLLMGSLDGHALDDRQQAHARRITEAVTRMQVRIDDLLELARVSRLEPSWRSVDLGRTLERVLEDLASRIEETKASIQVDALPTIEGDEALIELLFQNLLSNAIKYRRPEAAPEIRVTATTIGAGEDEAESWLELRVEDEGIGFDRTYAEQIFRPFERLHGRRDYEGSGVGLSVCRRVVEHHGGTISADAEPGGGARFTVRLPMSHDPGEERR